MPSRITKTPNRPLDPGLEGLLAVSERHESFTRILHEDLPVLVSPDCGGMKGDVVLVGVVSERAHVGVVRHRIQIEVERSDDSVRAESPNRRSQAFFEFRVLSVSSPWPTGSPDTYPLVPVEVGYGRLHID